MTRAEFWRSASSRTIDTAVASVGQHVGLAQLAARPAGRSRAPSRPSRRRAAPCGRASRSSASAAPASARWSARSRRFRCSARSWCSRGLVQLRVLDLVKERLVTDAEDLRRFAAVPACLLERPANQLALRFARGRTARCPSANRTSRARLLWQVLPARRPVGCLADRSVSGAWPAPESVRRAGHGPAIASATSRRIAVSLPRITIRLTRFSSSRTLPGHSYSANSRSVSVASASGGLL